MSSWLSNRLKAAEDFFENVDRRAADVLQGDIKDEADSPMAMPPSSRRGARNGGGPEGSLTHALPTVIVETPISTADLPTSVHELQGALAQQMSQTNALRQQVQQLNVELDAMDAQALNNKAQLDAANRRHQELQQELEHALSEAKQARKDAARLAARQLDTDADAMAGLRRELLEAQNERALLEDQLTSLKASHLLAVEAVRQEARAAEKRAEMVSKGIAAAREEAARREQELQAENSELSAALSAAHRALEDRTTQLQQSAEGSSSVSEIEAHLRREATAAAEAALMAERRQSAMLRKDVQALAQKLAVAQVECDEKAQQIRMMDRDYVAKVAELEKQVAEAKVVQQQDRSSQLEGRLRTLAESVVMKQGQIDALRSEKAALEQRLEIEQRKSQQAEAANHMGDGDLGDDGGDMEGGYHGSMRRRQGRMGSSSRMSRLRPLAENPQVARAVDVIDAFVSRSGAFLSREPVARLMFICYLVMLHLWGLFVLAFHTHRMELPSRK